MSVSSQFLQKAAAALTAILVSSLTAHAGTLAAGPLTANYVNGNSGDVVTCGIFNSNSSVVISSVSIVIYNSSGSSKSSSSCSTPTYSVSNLASCATSYTVPSAGASGLYTCKVVINNTPDGEAGVRGEFSVQSTIVGHAPYVVTPLR